MYLLLLPYNNQQAGLCDEVLKTWWWTLWGNSIYAELIISQRFSSPLNCYTLLTLPASTKICLIQLSNFEEDGIATAYYSPLQTQKINSSKITRLDLVEVCTAQGLLLLPTLPSQFGNTELYQFDHVFIDCDAWVV